MIIIRVIIRAKYFNLFLWKLLCNFLFNIFTIYNIFKSQNNNPEIFMSSKFTRHLLKNQKSFSRENSAIMQFSLIYSHIILSKIRTIILKFLRVRRIYSTFVEKSKVILTSQQTLSPLIFRFKSMERVFVNLPPPPPPPPAQLS